MSPVLKVVYRDAMARVGVGPWIWERGESGRWKWGQLQALRVRVVWHMKQDRTPGRHEWTDAEIGEVIKVEARHVRSWLALNEAQTIPA